MKLKTKLILSLAAIATIASGIVIAYNYASKNPGDSQKVVPITGITVPHPVKATFPPYSPTKNTIGKEAPIKDYNYGEVHSTHESIKDFNYGEVHSTHEPVKNAYTDPIRAIVVY